jgi:hypothetical protein
MKECYNQVEKGGLFRISGTIGRPSYKPDFDGCFYVLEPDLFMGFYLKNVNPNGQVCQHLLVGSWKLTAVLNQIAFLHLTDVETIPPEVFVCPDLDEREGKVFRYTKDGVGYKLDLASQTKVLVSVWPTEKNWFLVKQIFNTYKKVRGKSSPHILNLIQQDHGERLFKYLNA